MNWVKYWKSKEKLVSLLRKKERPLPPPSPVGREPEGERQFNY